MVSILPFTVLVKDKTIGRPPRRRDAERPTFWGAGRALVRYLRQVGPSHPLTIVVSYATAGEGINIPLIKKPPRIDGKTEEEALIAYLQNLGTSIKQRR